MKHGKEWRRHEEQVFSLTSMIDVTFLLLVFFLLTLKFRTFDGKLSAYLPKDQGGESHDVERMLDVEIVIRVVEPGRKVQPGTLREWGGEGRFEYDGRIVSYAAGAHPTTEPAVLAEQLERLRAGDPERKLKISARPGALVADAVLAVDVGIAAGFTEITFRGDR